MKFSPEREFDFSCKTKIAHYKELPPGSILGNTYRENMFYDSKSRQYLISST